MCKKTVGSPKVIPLKFPALQAGIKRENNQEPNLDLVCFFAIKNPKLVTLECVMMPTVAETGRLLRGTF